MNVLGIDIGGSGIKAAPVNLVTGNLTERRHRLDTPQPSTPESVGDVVRRMVEYFSWEGPVGVAFPARVKAGVVHTAVNISEQWLGINAEDLFADAIDRPVVVLNDADAACVAEMAFGVGRGHRGLVLMVTFGTGIGTGLFYGGRLIPNTELGHIELHGRDAETYAADRIRKEEQLSWEAWAGRVQEYLDQIEFLLSPDLIILGGGISRPHKRQQYMHLLKTQARLVTARLQNEAGIVGAAYAAGFASEA